MEKKNYSKLSNGELSRKLKEFNQEYEVKKKQILELVERLKELDALYNEVTNEINKRKESFVNGKYNN